MKLGEFLVIFTMGGFPCMRNYSYDIICRDSDKVSDIILRYRNKSGDYDKNTKFIFNDKDLNHNLSLAEAGITNCAHINIFKSQHLPQFINI